MDKRREERQKKMKMPPACLVYPPPMDHPPFLFLSLSSFLCSVCVCVWCNKNSKLIRFGRRRKKKKERAWTMSGMRKKTESKEKEVSADIVLWVK